MTISTHLEQATTQLLARYQPPEHPSGGASHNGWSRFVRTILGISSTHPANETLTDLLVSSSIATPSAAAGTTSGALVEILQPIPRGPQKSSVLRAVAAWWLNQFGDELSPQWSASVSSYRESLRQVRGLGPATVDELLLFAADLPVFPVDRTALRVAIRHGWIDWPIEDEVAQSFFVSGLDRSLTLMKDFSGLLSKVGDEFCGKEPSCEGCPLQSLLPASGPREC